MDEFNEKSKALRRIVGSIWRTIGFFFLVPCVHSVNGELEKASLWCRHVEVTRQIPNAFEWQKCDFKFIHWDN